MRILILIGLLFVFTINGKTQSKINRGDLIINLGSQASISKLFSKSITNKTLFENFGLTCEFYIKNDSSKISQRLLLELNFSNRKYEETQTEFPFYRDEINANTNLYQTKYTENLLSYDITQLFRVVNKSKMKLFTGVGVSLQFPVSSNGMREVSYNDGTKIELEKLNFYFSMGIGGMFRLNYEINKINFFSDFRGYFYLTSNHQRYGKVVFERDIDNNHMALRINFGVSYRIK